jgi:hypothetical protein
MFDVPVFAKAPPPENSFKNYAHEVLGRSSLEVGAPSS